MKRDYESIIESNNDSNVKNDAINDKEHEYQEFRKIIREKQHKIYDWKTEIQQLSNCVEKNEQFIDNNIFKMLELLKKKYPTFYRIKVLISLKEGFIVNENSWNNNECDDYFHESEQKIYANIDDARDEVKKLYTNKNKDILSLKYDMKYEVREYNLKISDKKFIKELFIY